jgi:uncharacterized membrane protein YdjX (TVP38/TMEM64 family)
MESDASRKGKVHEAGQVLRTGDHDDMKDFPVLSRLSMTARRALLVIAAILFVGLIYYLYDMEAWRGILRYYKYFVEPGRLGAFLSSFGPYAAVAFVVFQTLQVVAAPVPGEMTGFVGGLLFGWPGGLALSTVGLTCGSLLAFSISRRFGSGFVHKIVKREYIEKFDSFLTTHKGVGVAFALFLIPGFPKDYLCYLLGLTRMRYADFIIMNIFGRLPGTLILCMQGDAVRHGRYTSFWLLLSGGVLLAIALHFMKDRLVHLLAPSKHRDETPGEAREARGREGKTYTVAGKRRRVSAFSGNRQET